MIRAAGATPAAVRIALDRMERSGKDDALTVNSAVQEITNTYQMPVICIANLADLFDYLSSGQASELAQYTEAVKKYRAKYGVQN
jgi:orotate phosphoribosyltransferase